jgi:hypothetical protein
MKITCLDWACVFGNNQPYSSCSETEGRRFVSISDTFYFVVSDLCLSLSHCFTKAAKCF